MVCSILFKGFVIIMKLGTSKDHYYSPIGLSWAELLLFHTSVQLKKKESKIQVANCFRPQFLWSTCKSGLKENNLMWKVSISRWKFSLNSIPKLL